MSYSGIVPTRSELYTWCSSYLLPMVIILLLIQSKLSSMLKLGSKAIMVMLSGSIGVIIGSTVACYVLHDKLGVDSWKNLGAISASWTGGVVNMFAVKQALSIPDNTFAPIPIVDAIIAYAWMIVFMCLASRQMNYSKIFPSSAQYVDDLRKRSSSIVEEHRTQPKNAYSVLLAVAICGGCASVYMGIEIHSMALKYFRNSISDGIITAASMTMIMATIIGLALSFYIPGYGSEASNAGTAILYLLIQMYGAQINIRDIDKAGWWIVAGIVIVISMSTFMLVANCLLKGPLILIAVGGEANLAGPNSSAVLAMAYDPHMASLGILLGLLGGIIGTVCGLITSQICKFIVMP